MAGTALDIPASTTEELGVSQGAHAARTGGNYEVSKICSVVFYRLYPYLHVWSPDHGVLH